jgi:uncharacterized protein YecT (DUF1311 family)
MITGMLAMLLAGAPPAGCPDKSQAGLNLCAAAEYRAANMHLNHAYANLMAVLDPPGQQRLRAAQRSWIAFRDAECMLETAGGVNGQGSIAPLIGYECLRDLTSARSNRLRQMTHCAPPGLQCPAG